MDTKENISIDFPENAVDAGILMNERLIRNRIRAIVERFQVSRGHEFRDQVHVEAWCRSKFKLFFQHYKEDLYNPITKEHAPMRGFHEYNDDSLPFVKQPGHGIAIVIENGWESALRHELVHALQCELLGFGLYDNCVNAFTHCRQLDPFEFQAYSWEGIE